MPMPVHLIITALALCVNFCLLMWRASGPHSRPRDIRRLSIKPVMGGSLTRAKATYEKLVRQNCFRMGAQRRWPRERW